MHYRHVIDDEREPSRWIISVLRTPAHRAEAAQAALTSGMSRFRSAAAPGLAFLLTRLR